jgi:hypothetical protein
MLAGVVALVSIAGPLLGQETEDLTSEVPSGLVFVEGRFVPGPYFVDTSERDRAVEVLLAGVRLDRVAFGDSIENNDSPDASAEPEYRRPAGCDRLSGSGYPLYLHRLLEYHAAREGYAEALARVEQEASQSPLVARLERHRSGLLLFDKHDDPYLVRATPDLVGPALTREAAQALAERTLGVYRELLRQGGAILHFHAADLFLPRERVVDLLVPSLEILEDPIWPAEEKRRRLDDLWHDDGIVEAMLAGFAPTPELEMAMQPYREGGDR